MPPVPAWAMRFAARITVVRAVVVIGTVAVCLTVAGAIVVRLAEPDTFGSTGGALWWALQTVSTVGYGDLAPVTAAGRAVGTVLMLLAVAVVPAITAVVVAVLVTGLQRRAGGAGSAADQARLDERLARIERALGIDDEPGASAGSR
jgi:voltage-gated potassium channel